MMLNFYTHKMNEPLKNGVCRVPDSFRKIFVSDEKHTYRGSIADILKEDKAKNLGIVHRLVVKSDCTDHALEDPQNMSNKGLVELMKVVNHNPQIKELDLYTCTLKPDQGQILGVAMALNTSLETLAFDTGELGRTDIMHFLNALKDNHGLKTLMILTPSLASYQWKFNEMKALSELVRHHKTLSFIDLTYNGISIDCHEVTIPMLAQPYKDIEDRALPLLRMKFDSKDVVFSKESACCGCLDKLAETRFYPPREPYRSKI